MGPSCPSRRNPARRSGKELSGIDGDAGGGAHNRVGLGTTVAKKMQRILLADDDQAFCELLREYLGRQGYEIDAVHDGVAAIKSASEGQYDVMVLDVMMPKADGFRVLKELRSPGRMPILMLTARGDDEIGRAHV